MRTRVIDVITDEGAKMIGILDTSPAFAGGLAGALREVGIPATTYTSLDQAVEGRQVNEATVLGVEGPSDAEMVARLAGEGPIIAIVDQLDIPDCLTVMSAGASSLMSRRSTLDLLIRGVRCALDGVSLLPLTVVREIATLFPASEPAPGSLDERDREWLERLSEGMSVSDMASTYNYSRRQMQRRLSGLYVRMGVTNRAAAIARAARWHAL